MSQPQCIQVAGLLPSKLDGRRGRVIMVRNDFHNVNHPNKAVAAVEPPPPPNDRFGLK